MSALKIIAPVALLTLLSVAAQPVLADQQRGRDDRRRGDSGVRATPRDSGRQNSDGRRGDVRRESAPQSRSSEARGSYSSSNRDSRGSDARTYARRGNDARSYNSNNNRNDSYRNDSYRNDSYRNDSYRNDSYRNSSYRRAEIAPRNYSSGWGRAAARPYRSYGSSYRPSYRSSYRSWYRSDYYYSRPYYSFRPRFSIGFGVWLGYPISLPSYGYAPYPVYGYPSGGYVNVTPSRAQYGAVSFEISPADADLYVDGTLVGRVGDFDPNNPPLTLTPGTHQIEVVADGYEPLTFDADVAPGQVIPYRGEMRPY